MPQERFIYRYRIYHLLFWLALFGAWYYFRYQDFPTQRMAIQVTTIKVIDLALMVYLTNYFLIPRLLYQKKYFAFGFVFFLLISSSSLFKLYIVGNMLNPAGNFVLFDENFKVRVYDNVIPHFLLVSTGAAFKLLLDYARMQRKVGEIAKEKAEAELNFLKSQINPHFLFNSLNSVYFLIDKNNTEARQALHKFSEMLRYQLYELKGSRIPIEKEVGFLEDYVGLQKLRRENCQISFHYPANLKGFSIEPLLLIPFVENSFKHLSDYPSDRRNQVKIGLDRINGELQFFVENTTSGAQLPSEEKGGIGLNNVKRRLELLYPGRHSLQVIEKGDRFRIELRLVLTGEESGVFK